MLTIDAEALRPLITAIVRETVAAVEATNTRASDRLAYTEPEAAVLLGLARHQLRDSRLRGEIRASRVGKRMLYSKAELVSYLDRKRE